MSEITIAVMSPSQETAGLLRAQVLATGLAVVKLEVGEYCITRGDRPARLLAESQPDLILVDMQDVNAAMQSLDVLHSMLPNSWLFVCSDEDDPQLIIKTMHAGAREFLPKPVTTRSLSQAISRYLSEQLKKNNIRLSGELYCVTAAKAGAGATSVALNLATAVATVANSKVSLIDLGAPVGDVAAFLNLRPKFTVADALSSTTRLDPVLLDSYTTIANGVAVLAGLQTYRPETAPAAQIGRLLEVVGETYSHSFVDFQLSLGPEQVRLLTEVSKAILLVVTPELPSVWRADRLLRYMSDHQCLEKVRLIVNRSRRADELRDTEIEKAIRQPVFWKLPNDYEAAIQAINSGKPLTVGDNSELARSYRELASSLTGTTAPERKRGLLKIFS